MEWILHTAVTRPAASPDGETIPMPKPKLLLRAALPAALVALAVFSACHRQDTDNAPPPVVRTVTAERVDVRQEISASGVIEAVDKVQLGFLVPGRVREVAVEDGADVTAGQLLARIDDADLRNEAAIADARLVETKARHERLTRLHELGSLTPTDFEKSAAALSESESAAALAHRRLGYAELHAPFAGRFVRQGLSVGSVVVPGVPVCTVSAAAPVWASLSVPEVDAPKLRPGLPATVSLAATDSPPAHSTIETILPQADALTRSFLVRIKLANEDGRFRLGNVVTAKVSTGATHSSIVLPPSLIQRFPDGALYVWTAEPGRSVVTRRIVTVGRPAATGVEVLSGLQPGDRVVETGATTLYEGMPVQLATP